MKRLLLLLSIIGIMASCQVNPTPYYQTKKGKKKQKYYNDIQFGGKKASGMKKP